MTEGEALEAAAVRLVSGREPFDPRTRHRRLVRPPPPYTHGIGGRSGRRRSQQQEAVSTGRGDL